MTWDEHKGMNRGSSGDRWWTRRFRTWGRRLWGSGREGGRLYGFIAMFMFLSLIMGWHYTLLDFSLSLICLWNYQVVLQNKCFRLLNLSLLHKLFFQLLCSHKARAAKIKGETTKISDLKGVKKPEMTPRPLMCQVLAVMWTEHTPPLHTQNTEPEAETWGFAKCQVTNRAAWLFFFLKPSD